MVVRDTDGDGQPDFLDVDSDNDGLPDILENQDKDQSGISDRLEYESGVKTGASAGFSKASLLCILLSLFFYRLSQRQTNMM